MPTTVTKSIGSAGGRDYSNIAAWEAACPSNLVTADQIWRGELYNDSEFLNPTVIVGPVTSDSTRYVELTTATGQSFADHANKLTNALKYDQSKGVGLRITGSYQYFINTSGSPHFRMSKVQMHYDSVYSSNYYVPFIFHINTIASQLLLETRRTASIDARVDGKLINSIIVNRGATFSGNGVLTSGGEFRNVTIVRPSDLGGGGTGLTFSGTGPTVKNCAVFGFTTQFGGVIGSYNASSSHNASSVASGSIPGTSPQANLTYSGQFENVNNATRDYRAKSAGSLDGNGTRDAANTNDLDIVGQSRSTTAPTIGAWEVAASASAALFASSASTSATTTVALSTGMSFASNVDVSAISSASLSTSINFTSNVAASGSYTSASLETSIPLATTTTASAECSASLSTGSAALESIASIVASVEASLNTAVRLAANSSSTATSSADLSTGITLQNTVSSSVSVSAALATGVSLTAVTPITANVTADLFTAIRFSGLAQPSAAAAAWIETSILLSSIASATSRGLARIADVSSVTSIQSDHILVAEARRRTIVGPRRTRVLGE